jgi:hypothetical protein
MKHLLLTLLAVFTMIAAGILSFVIVPNGENLLSGKVTTMVYILETPPEGCAVNLSEGVNMVSFLCETGEINVTDGLLDRNNASLDYSAVYIYNPNNPLDSWTSYNPSLPSWAVQNPFYLNRRYGYAIKMNSAGEYFNDGYRYMSTTIDLQSGWNFIGYPSDVPINITVALNQISGKYTIVEAYTPVDGTKTWLYHVPVAGGDLSYMNPMVGYWIYMNQSASVVVNW